METLKDLNGISIMIGGIQLFNFMKVFFNILVRQILKWRVKNAKKIQEEIIMAWIEKNLSSKITLLEGPQKVVF